MGPGADPRRGPLSVGSSRAGRLFLLSFRRTSPFPPAAYGGIRFRRSHTGSMWAAHGQGSRSPAPAAFPVLPLRGKLPFPGARMPASACRQRVQLP